MQRWKTMFHGRRLAVIGTLAVMVVVVGGVAVWATTARGRSDRTLNSQRQAQKQKPPARLEGTQPKPVAVSNSGYNQLILGDHPVAFWPLNATGTHANDLSSNGFNGTFEGGLSATTSMPNGDEAVDFGGKNQYLSVPSNPAFSVPTTHELTWEGWIKSSTLQFNNASSTGYVEWMGKCLNHAPNCEWAARMYSAPTPQDRCSRLSAYIFNSSAGLGSGAFWQPACDTVTASQWLYVVGEYDENSTPSGCDSAHPGSINIWVNGVEWNQADHAPTGCMSQYKVTPTAGNSPLTIGTASRDTWFQGAIGKVAIYNYLLSSSQITSHYQAMTGLSPSGSCSQTCSF